MKFTLILFGTLFSLITQASQFEMIEGVDALSTFNQLTGKKCVEYQTSYQIVYSKTNKQSCYEGNDLNEWQCVVQYEKTKGTLVLQSVSCTREIN